MIDTNRLQQLMELYHLNKVRLSEISGISDVTIAKILKGADSKISSVEAIAKALGVPVGYFFEDSYSTYDNFISSQNTAYIKGSNNTLIGRDNAIIEKEVEHLKAIIAEKERTIQILMNYARNTN